MSSLHAYSSLSHDVFAARSIFRRCVQCDSSPPPCPKCDKGSTCTVISQSCDRCAYPKCIRTSSASSDSGTKSSSRAGAGGASNAGAIAGGVIGGVAFIAIVTLLVWWFFIRKRRNDQSQDLSDGQEKERASSSTGPPQPGQTRNSIASTVLTRASNVIPIAYIPGVTNRSPPETPGGLVPPVPPLPGASPEQHFFVPGDLRDSAWSGTSGLTSGQSSVTPTTRSSVATTVYRNDAVVDPMPAQPAMRTRAAVVNIQNGNNPAGSTPSLKVTPPDAPAVPVITEAQLSKAGGAPEVNSSPVLARHVTAKPVTVTRSGSKKGSSEQQESTPSSSSGGSNDHTTPTSSSAVKSTVGPSPFEDQPEPVGQTIRHPKPASTDSTQKKESANRGESPFSDLNEM